MYMYNRTENSSLRTYLPIFQVTALALIRVFASQDWRLVTGLTSHHALAVRTPSTLWFERSAATGQKPRTFLLGLSGRGSLYAIDAPLVCITLLRSVIARLWFPGLRTEKNGLVVYKFKLCEKPWFQAQRKAIRSRFLLVCVLEELRFLGWKVQAALNPTGGSNDVACFCLETAPPLNCTYLCISFVQDDSLWLVNAPASVVDKLREELVSSVMALKQDDLYKGCHRFQFCDSLAKVPSVICVLLDTLVGLGWAFVTAASTTKFCLEKEDPLNRIWSNAAHSLFFEKSISIEESL